MHTATNTNTHISIQLHEHTYAHCIAYVYEGQYIIAQQRTHTHGWSLPQDYTHTPTYKKTCKAHLQKYVNFHEYSYKQTSMSILTSTLISVCNL